MVHEFHPIATQITAEVDRACRSRVHKLNSKSDAECVLAFINRRICEVWYDRQADGTWKYRGRIVEYVTK
jgi:hypothetical protein